MQYLFDETGRRYLDLFGGIVTVSVGHCHPKVIARAKAHQKQDGQAQKKDQRQKGDKADFTGSGLSAHGILSVSKRARARFCRR